MCFGGKNERDEDDTAAARPASNENNKMNYGQGNQQYAPPPGPPPGRQQDYAPPSGPPPGRGDYAPPTGPPPGQQQYAPPSGPPPSLLNQNYAPPPGPPPSHQSQHYAPPSGPPPGHQNQNQQYAPPSGPPPSHQGQHYAPPSGPPPSHQGQHYAPPSGPPPGHQNQSQQYAPPSGPPPDYKGGDYAPPPGPPPPQDWAAPPKEQTKEQAQHDWESLVPDTSLFPPPPAIFSGYEVSPSSNATEEQAEAGEEWCGQNPLTRPMDAGQANDPAMLQALQTKNIRLMEPMGFNGKLTFVSPGHWQVTTNRNAPDRCLISYPPLYSVQLHDPSRYNVPKTIYYEVNLLRESKNNFVAMGFTALPYPSFRMPGWHRGSLAIHGDDGHKYINDRWGGKDFTTEFRKGETLGVGMTLSPGEQSHKPKVVIFFTRDGRRERNMEWNLHEETDAEEDLPVTGMEGFHDLCCAVGTYDAVSFEVIFDPARWKYDTRGLNI